MLPTKHAMNAFFVRVPRAAELELRLNAGVKKHIGLQVLTNWNFPARQSNKAIYFSLFYFPGLTYTASIGYNSSDRQPAKNSTHKFASPTAQRHVFRQLIGQLDTGPKARDTASLKPFRKYLGSGSRDASAEEFATGGVVTK